jgi:hypothetical protein
VRVKERQVRSFARFAAAAILSTTSSSISKKARRATDPHDENILAFGESEDEIGCLNTTVAHSAAITLSNDALEYPLQHDAVASLVVN